MEPDLDRLRVVVVREMRRALRDGCADVLFLPEDGILSGFDDSKFQDSFGRNLNLLTGLWIAANPGLPVGEFELADSRNSEDVFGFTIGQGGKFIEKLHHSFLGESRFPSKMFRDL